MEDTAGAVTRRQECRHCREPVTVTGPPELEAPHRKAVHTATGAEHCADGEHLAAPIDATVTREAAATARDRKPTAAELGADLAALEWQRSGDASDALEVAFPEGPSWERGDWVLMRKAGDGSGRVLVFDRNEWDCFLDGARGGEFDDLAAEPAAAGGAG